MNRTPLLCFAASGGLIEFMAAAFAGHRDMAHAPGDAQLLMAIGAIEVAVELSVAEAVEGLAHPGQKGVHQIHKPDVFLYALLAISGQDSKGRIDKQGQG